MKQIESPTNILTGEAHGNHRMALSLTGQVIVQRQHLVMDTPLWEDLQRQIQLDLDQPYGRLLASLTVWFTMHEPLKDVPEVPALLDSALKMLKVVHWYHHNAPQLSGYQHPTG